MKKLFTLSLVLYAAICCAQYPRVDIPGSEVRRLTSTIVSGQEYELQILLPGNYKSSTKKYPVVYLMDSQWDFPLVKSLYGEHYFDGFIPELIIVGVTWGGLNPNPDSLRARDYTPTKEARAPQSGGADAFLSFMKKELFPFVETNYRADPDNRTLMGCSLGGLFTLYTLFTQPEMFNGYAAASPAIGWDKEVLYKYEAAFAAKKTTKPVRVYMTVGDVERSRPVFEKFAAKMKSSNYPSAAIHSKVLENTGHSGTKSETYGRGLQFVFERPKLKLSPSVLNAYAGKYEMNNKSTVEIKVEDGQLVVYPSPNEKMSLFAASDSEFYSTSEFLTLYFTKDKDQTIGRVELYGNTITLKKIK